MRKIIFILLLLIMGSCYLSAKLFAADNLQDEYYPTGELWIKWQKVSDNGGINRKEYYTNGQLRSDGTYINEKLEGLYQEYFEDGGLYLEINFNGGKEDGLYKEYNSQNVLVKEVEFKNGLMDGFYREYFDNGKVSKEIMFASGLKNGEEKIYYPSGALQIKATFKFDQLNGPYEEYAENGKLTVKQVMKNNQVLDDKNQTSPNAKQQPRFNPDKLYSPYIHASSEDEIDSSASINDVLSSKEDISKKLKKVSRLYVAKFKEGKSLGFYIFLIVIVAMLIVAFIYLNSTHSPGRSNNSGERSEYKQSPTVSNKEFNFLNEEASLFMYRKLVESVSSGIFVADLNGNLIFANYALMGILDIKSKTDIFGFNINDRFSGMENEKRVLLEDIKNKGGGKYKYFLSKEKELILNVTAGYIVNERTMPQSIQGVIQDISEQGQLQETLLAEKQKMSSMLKIFEQVDEIKDIDELVEYCVKSVADLFAANRCSLMMLDKDGSHLTIKSGYGFKEEKVAGLRFSKHESISGMVAIKNKAVLVKNIEYDQEFLHMRKKSPNYLGRSFMIAPLEFNDQVIGVINVSEKREEIKHAEPFDEIDLKILQHVATKISAAIKNVELFEELNLLTHTDPLTQIYNYRLLSESLDREIKRFKRDKNPLCVFMMDLDGFKSYNDSFGHLEGDELLKKLGAILKSNLRETDIACRYAGDEFCAILPNTNLEGVKNAADKIIKAVATTTFKKQVTISIGAAMYEDGMVKKDFLAKADKALYQAKHGGKNQVIIFS